MNDMTSTTTRRPRPAPVHLTIAAEERIASLMTHLGVDATARASFGVYSGRQDVEALVRGIERVTRIFA